jgi:2-polyprenyl-6-methoxyphenol hydroxylase-like FAD-dependent oxidoreductase
MADVIVVGGGPTGLLLASELKLAGADPLVLEAASEPDRPLRALGLRGINGRSVQTLALRGLEEPLRKAQWAMFEEFRSASTAADEAGGLVSLLHEGRARGHFAGLPLVDDGPGRGPRNILLKQSLLEDVLAAHARSLGVRIETGWEVADVVEEYDRVVAVAADGRTERARYLVGCDGGRSVVRKLAGIAFPGTAPTMTGRTAVAELADPGAVTSSLRGSGGLVNLSMVPGEIATIEFDGGPAERDTPVTAEELAGSIGRTGGVDVEVAKFGTAIRYSDNTRQAETYRRGRVLLAGDAAHVHSPIGGQGLNLGLQDAVNLGWKLGLVVRGAAPESLLDTYTAERHPVGERVLRNTRAQVALMRPGPQVDALRDVMGETLAIPAVKARFIDLANGFDIDYAPDAHSLVGRFSPRELDLADGRTVLIGAEPPPGYEDRIRAVDGDEALLVRPDGYVAWAGSGSLTEALSTWFGAPASVFS